LKVALERDVVALPVPQGPTAAELTGRPSEESFTH
jgi:hypothetical protein